MKHRDEAQIFPSESKNPAQHRDGDGRRDHRVPSASRCKIRFMGPNYPGVEFSDCKEGMDPLLNQLKGFKLIYSYSSSKGDYINL